MGQTSETGFRLTRDLRFVFSQLTFKSLAFSCLVVFSRVAGGVQDGLGRHVGGGRLHLRLQAPPAVQREA